MARAHLFQLILVLFHCCLLQYSFIDDDFLIVKKKKKNDYHDSRNPPKKKKKCNYVLLKCSSSLESSNAYITSFSLSTLHSYIILLLAMLYHAIPAMHSSNLGLQNFLRWDVEANTSVLPQLYLGKVSRH